MTCGSKPKEVNGFTEQADMLEQFARPRELNILVNATPSAEHQAVLQCSLRRREKLAELEQCLLETRPSGEICAICHDDMRGRSLCARLPCGHEFHRACIRKWLIKGKPQCPLCNGSLIPDSEG